LQDRLVKELRLAGISDLEAANAFLPGFIRELQQQVRPTAGAGSGPAPAAGRAE
jgi:hypothetical protein